MDNAQILLIVDEALDDEAFDPEAMGHALGRANMKLEVMKVAQTEVASPSGILREMPGRSYDCILLDDSLPGTKRRKLIEALCAAGSTTPVVVLSGQDNEGEDEAFLAAGAADHIRKDTVKEQQFVHRLGNTVRAYRAEERARHAMNQLAAERGLLEGVVEALHRIDGVVTAQRDQVMRDQAMGDQAMDDPTTREQARQDKAMRDEAALIDAVSREAARMLGAEFGVFYYNDAGEQGETYTARWIQHMDDAALSRLTSAISPQLAQTFRSGGVVRIADITRDPRFVAVLRPADAPTLHSYMAVPVSSSSGRLAGGLFFGHSRAAVFSERHERAARGIACLTAMAMDNIRLRAQAQQAVRVSDEFLSVVSHDLRNPLNTISIAAESMGDVGEITTDKRQRYVAAIRRGVDRANRLVSDVLDAGKIDAGKLRIEPTRTTVHRLVDQATRDHASQAEKRGVSLVTAVPAATPKVLADAGRIRQVFYHLITNALRCTESGGRVELSAHPDNDAVCITVSDTGIGIPEQDLPRICDRFYQVSQQHRTGPGLGLYIAKGIIEAHHGHLTVESEPGSGTTIRFTLAQATP